MKCLVAVLAALCACGACATQQPAKPPAAAASADAGMTIAAGSVLPAVTPMRTWEGLAMVQALVGDRDLQPFVLDTGLAVNAFSPAGVKRLALTPGAGKLVTDLLGSTVTGNEVILPSIRLGGLKVQNVPAAVIDVGSLLAGENRPDAPAGWLGIPFVQAFQVMLNFAQGSVIVSPLSAPLPKTRDSILAPITVTRGRMWVDVTVPGARPFPAVIDTGSGGTLIPQAAAASLGLKPASTSTITLNGKAATACTAVVPAIRVGKADVRDCRVVYLSPGAGVDPQPAVLGLDFLSRFTVTINCKRRQMLLTPVRATPPPPQKHGRVK